MTHNEWRRRRCVHCAAGVKLDSGLHFLAPLPGNVAMDVVECTAPSEAEHIAELEAKCEALVGALRGIAGYKGKALITSVTDDGYREGYNTASNRAFEQCAAIAISALGDSVDVVAGEGK